MTSYLWLLGWCNTGNSRQEAQSALRKLTEDLFGYELNEQHRYLQTETGECDLKRFRWGRYEQELQEIQKIVIQSHEQSMAIQPG